MKCRCLRKSGLMDLVIAWGILAMKQMQTGHVKIPLGVSVYQTLNPHSYEHLGIPHSPVLSLHWKIRPHFSLKCWFAWPLQCSSVFASFWPFSLNDLCLRVLSGIILADTKCFWRPMVETSEVESGEMELTLALLVWWDGGMMGLWHSATPFATIMTKCGVVCVCVCVCVCPHMCVQVCTACVNMGIFDWVFAWPASAWVHESRGLAILLIWKDSVYAFWEAPALLGR